MKKLFEELVFMRSAVTLNITNCFINVQLCLTYTKVLLAPVQCRARCTTYGITLGLIITWIDI